MARLKLTVLTGDYEIVRALKEGEVVAEGLELEFLPYPGVSEIHREVVGGESCDIGEFNAPAYIMSVSQAQGLTALPIFLHRRFRHGFIWINKRAGIQKPTDLIGKRIGEVSFLPACNVWVHGILESEFNVPHTSVTWVSQRQPVIPFEPHKGLRIEYLPRGMNVEEMLVDGSVDAMIAPNPIRPIREGRPEVGHLWPNYRELEIDYFRHTGIFPIMHVTTIRKEIVSEHPWVVRPLMDAFEQSKQIAFKRLSNPRVVPLAWYRSYSEDEHAFLGADPWEYGLSAVNRKNLETLAGYCHLQGLTPRRMKIEELFASESLDWIASEK